MDKFEAMQMFVRLVEKGSFSAVAKERGIGQPAVSKQISALEDARHRTDSPYLSLDCKLRQVATFTSLHCTFSTTLRTRLHESAEARLHRKASFA